MFQRVAQGGRRGSARDAIIPAPTRGWVKAGNVTQAGPDQAEVLDNFFPTAQSARLRRGSETYAEIGAQVRSFLAYSAAVSNLFAASDTEIFDCDRLNAAPANDWADLTGFAGGAWATTQISTSGGVFLIAANGVNPMLYWDGVSFYPIAGAAVNNLGYDALTAAFTVGQTVTGGTSGATATILAIVQTSATAGTFRLGTITGTFQDNETITSSTGSATVNGTASSGSSVTITGISTSAISQVWVYKERVFLTEKGTQSAWYLPVESIGGAASEIPLGSIFRRGGSLLFGATWSVDSGSGLDDLCVFVSDNGEVAVFQGNDPSSADDWTIVGVYDIARPISAVGHFKAGGDLAILTDDGIIPLSAALQKDRAALQGTAITFPIEDAWREAVSNRTSAYPVTATLWQAQGYLIVGVPNVGSTYQAFVANARTGAWCRYTGWDVRASVVLGESLYFGTSDGRVMLAETGGNDDGVQYTGVYVPKFQNFNAPSLKMALHAAATVQARPNVNFRLVAHGDYKVADVAAPEAMTEPTGDTWGTGVWGTFVWGGSSYSTPQTVWRAVTAQGYALSVGLYVTANQTPEPQFDILAMQVRYEAGAVF